MAPLGPLKERDPEAIGGRRGGSGGWKRLVTRIPASQRTLARLSQLRSTLVASLSAGSGVSSNLEVARSCSHRTRRTPAQLSVREEVHWEGRVRTHYPSASAHAPAVAHADGGLQLLAVTGPVACQKPSTPASCHSFHGNYTRPPRRPNRPTLSPPRRPPHRLRPSKQHLSVSAPPAAPPAHPASARPRRNERRARRRRARPVLPLRRRAAIRGPHQSHRRPLGCANDPRHVARRG